MRKELRIGKLFLYFYFFINSLSLFSTNNNSIAGARCKGMASTSVAIKDFWSVCNNLAVMPFYNKMGVGIDYDNRFMLKETSTTCIGAIVPVDKTGVFGVHINHFGYNNYGALNAGLGYAKSFANVFAFGVKFDYLLNYFGDATYGKCNGFTFEIGLYQQITKSLGIGFHVFNPAHLKMTTYNDTKEYIPTMLRLGLAYSLSRHCLFSVEIEKDMDLKTVYRCGIEYSICESFYLRGGVNFPYFEFTCGVGIYLKNLSIDFASSYHTILGYSPQLSLVYAIKR